MTSVSGTSRLLVCRVLTCMDWESGSYFLARVLEVFGDGRLKVLVSRFGEVLVMVGLVERVFEGLLIAYLSGIMTMGMKDRMRDDETARDVTTAKTENKRGNDQKEEKRRQSRNKASVE
jgi:hypothetical protein